MSHSCTGTPSTVRPATVTEGDALMVSSTRSWAFMCLTFYLSSTGCVVTTRSTVTITLLMLSDLMPDLYYLTLNTSPT